MQESRPPRGRTLRIRPDGKVVPARTDPTPAPKSPPPSTRPSSPPPAPPQRPANDFELPANPPARPANDFEFPANAPPRGLPTISSSRRTHVPHRTRGTAAYGAIICASGRWGQSTAGAKVPRRRKAAPRRNQRSERRSPELEQEERRETQGPAAVDLSVWKGRISGATQGLQPGDTSPLENGPDELSTSANKKIDERRKGRPDHLKDAQARSSHRPRTRRNRRPSTPRFPMAWCRASTTDPPYAASRRHPRADGCPSKARRPLGSRSSSAASPGPAADEGPGKDAGRSRPDRKGRSRTRRPRRNWQSSNRRKEAPPKPANVSGAITLKGECSAERRSPSAGAGVTDRRCCCEGHGKRRPDRRARDDRGATPSRGDL